MKKPSLKIVAASGLGLCVACFVILLLIGTSASQAGFPQSGKDAVKAVGKSLKVLKLFRSQDHGKP